MAGSTDTNGSRVMFFFLFDGIAIRPNSQRGYLFLLVHGRIRHAFGSVDRALDGAQTMVFVMIGLSMVSTSQLTVCMDGMLDLYKFRPKDGMA